MPPAISAMPFVLSLPELMSTPLNAQITSSPKAIVNVESRDDVDDHQPPRGSLLTSA